ncbi:MAG: hypothetical protein COV75_06370 [Candidatus Omnitrophica bacterium CG11_big_fil_rev_8_21_14_0_20_63_9]|nr:MAG: hypothetical protein COV75_06370 [Candidatus Omnitrophica bacterium CG11_big_fil_rev_8_21_14_0_20_63_9]
MKEQTMTRRMFQVGFWGVLAVLMACHVAAAQEMKVGYVRLTDLFNNYERTKLSESTLEKKGKQKDTELQGRINELKKLRESLELLSDQAREAKAREVEQKQDELQRFRTNTLRDLKRDRDKEANAIFGDIQKAVEEFAKANGFSMILKEEQVLLYGTPTYDVTDAILKTLNGRYGGKNQ